MIANRVCPIRCRDRTFWIPWILAAAVIALSACKDESPSLSRSQPLVRVNNDEITARQVDYVLAHLPESQRHDQLLTEKILEQFVDQQLLLQKALEHRLDQDPNVILALEQTRRQILAQAYLDRLGSTAGVPEEAEIKIYYRQHPELFSQRRIYRLQQIVASKTLPFAELQARTEGRVGTAELVRWLQEQKTLVGVETSLSPAEKISTEILPKLQVMKKGERLAWETPEHNVVVVMLDSSAQPFTEAEAAPLIKEFLSNEKRKARGQEELARLRQSATIQWLRESAKRPSGFGDGSKQDKSADRYRASPVSGDPVYFKENLSASR